MITRVLIAYIFFATFSFPAGAVVIDSYNGSYEVLEGATHLHSGADYTRQVRADSGDVFLGSGHARFAFGTTDQFDATISTQHNFGLDLTDGGLSDTVYLDFVDDLGTGYFILLQLQVTDTFGNSYSWFGPTGLAGPDSAFFELESAISSVVDVTSIEQVRLEVSASGFSNASVVPELDELYTAAAPSELPRGSVPEPSTFMLFGVGIAGLNLFRRRSGFHLLEVRLHTNSASA